MVISINWDYSLSDTTGYCIVFSKIIIHSSVCQIVFINERLGMTCRRLRILKNYSGLACQGKKIYAEVSTALGIRLFECIRSYYRDNMSVLTQTNLL